MKRSQVLRTRQERSTTLCHASARLRRRRAIGSRSRRESAQSQSSTTSSPADHFEVAVRTRDPSRSGSDVSDHLPVLVDASASRHPKRIPQTEIRRRGSGSRTDGLQAGGGSGDHRSHVHRFAVPGTHRSKRVPTFRRLMKPEYRRLSARMHARAADRPMPPAQLLTAPRVCVAQGLLHRSCSDKPRLKDEVELWLVRWLRVRPFFRAKPRMHGAGRQQVSRRCPCPVVFDRPPQAAVFPPIQGTDCHFHHGEPINGGVGRVRYSDR